MRLNKRQERLAEGGHWPTTYKRNIGSTPIYPCRQLYGTMVRCECGWTFKTNESPTKGGNKMCIEAWEIHAWEQLEKHAE